MTTDATTPATLGSYGSLVRRWYPLILLPTLLGAVVGFVLAQGQPAQYVAVVDVLVVGDVSGPSQTTNPGRGTVDMTTEVQIATSGRVTQQVAQRLDDESTEPELRSRVAVRAEGDSKVLTFRYTAESPSASRQTALAFAEEYLDYRGDRAREELDSRRSSLQSRSEQLREQLGAVTLALSQATAGSAEAAASSAQQTALAAQLAQIGLQMADIDGFVVNPGQVITTPDAAPDRAGIGAPVFIVSGAALGLLAGLLLALWRERSDDRISLAGPGSTPVGLPAPVLGRLPDLSSGAAGSSAGGDIPEVHYLSTRLLAMTRRSPMTVIAFAPLTSTQPVAELLGNVAVELSHGSGGRVAVILREEAHQLAAVPAVRTAPPAQPASAAASEADIVPVVAAGGPGSADTPSPPAPEAMATAARSAARGSVRIAPWGQDVDDPLAGPRADGRTELAAAAGRQVPATDSLPGPAAPVAAQYGPDAAGPDPAPGARDESPLRPLDARPQALAETGQPRAADALLGSVAREHPVDGTTRNSTGWPAGGSGLADGARWAHPAPAAQSLLIAAASSPRTPHPQGPSVATEGRHGPTPRPARGGETPELPHVHVVGRSGRDVARDLTAACALLGQRSEWVLVEAPPLLDGDISDFIAPADGVLVLVDGSELRRRHLDAVQEAMQWSEAPLLGFVTVDKRRKKRTPAPAKRVRR